MTRSTALDPGLEGKGGLVLKVQCARRWVPFPKFSVLPECCVKISNF